MSYEQDPFYPETPFERYVDNELRKISDALIENSVEVVELKVWHTEPDKPRQGQLYYADGSDWDPLASGEGLYRHTGSAWVKVG